MAWLRLDEHLPENRKVQSLPAELFKLWINLLCISKSTEGKLTNLAQAAFRLRIPEKRFFPSIDRLVSAGLIESEIPETGESGPRYFIHDWEDWQYKSDVSTTRVKRFRKRRETVSRNGHQQLHETPLSDAALFCSESGTSKPKNSNVSLPQLGGDFPLTIAEIRKHDPAVDDFFVMKLANAVSQKVLSTKDFPPDRLECVDDKTISLACRESYATGPLNHKTGLLLSRVPPIIVTWGLAE